MDYGKYIVINECHIIIFDPAMNHSDIGRHFKDQVTSAGFIMTGVDANNEVLVQCYGRSQTLGIGSNPNADSVLARFAIGKW